MRKPLTLLSLCSLIVLFSCTKPSGVEVTEHFPINSSYYKLYISDGMKVTVTNQVNDIVITADENVMEKINVECRNGQLKIYRRDISLIRVMKAEVLIPYNYGLHHLEVDSYSTFTSPFGIEGDEVKIIITDFSDVDVNYIQANELDLKLDNNSDFVGDLSVMDYLDLRINRSDVELTGDATNVHLTMSENSDFIERWGSNGGYSFECDYCYGTMTDNCKAYFHCFDKIAVALTDNCFLHCTGEPDIDESTWDNTSCIIFDDYRK